MKRAFYLRLVQTGLLALAIFLPVMENSAQTTAPPVSGDQVFEYDVNGMKVLIKPRAGTPTVAAGLFIRGGVRNLTPENAGIENLMLNTAVEGSKKFPRAILRKEIAKTGSSIAGGINFDYSGLSVVSTKQNFDRSWDIFTDITLNPAFTPADIDVVRKRILQGLISTSDSPEGMLETELSKVIYAKHPYALDPEGTIANITKFTAADLLAYHKKLMQTSQLLLVVVGDVDPEVLQKRIAASFGKLPRGDYKETPLPAITFTEGSVNVTSRPVQTNYVKGVFTAPAIGEPDYYAMRVVIAMLQQMVYQEVRVRANLSYAPAAEINSMASNTGSISVSSARVNDAVKIMLAQIDKLKQMKLTDETITGLGSYFLTTYYLSQETNAAQTRELGSYELTGGGWKNSQVFLEKMRGVTADDVNRAAQKYLKNIRFVVVGNPADVDQKVFLAQGAVE